MVGVGRGVDAKGAWVPPKPPTSSMDLQEVATIPKHLLDLLSRSLQAAPTDEWTWNDDDFDDSRLNNDCADRNLASTDSVTFPYIVDCVFDLEMVVVCRFQTALIMKRAGGEFQLMSRISGCVDEQFVHQKS